MKNTSAVISVEIDGVEIAVNSLSVDYTIGSPIPTASVTVGHKDYVFVANLLANSPFKLAEITAAIYQGGVKSKTITLDGVITSLSASEDYFGLSNTFTVSPLCFYATLKTGSFDGSNRTDYVENMTLLANDVITYFNNFVFTGLPKALSIGNVVTPPPERFLLVAPVFIGKTLHQILSEIYGGYGYSVQLTWDNLVVVGSLNKPAASSVYITKNMIKSASYQEDSVLSFSKLNLGW